MVLILVHFTYVCPHYLHIVKQTTGVDSSGSSVTCSLPLAVKPLAKSASYDIAEEDPSVYSDEEDFDVGFVLRREWKEVPLPSKPKEGEDTFKYLAEAQRAHDFHASLLATHGIDACKVSHLSKATTVLENVTKEDKTCFICHKELAGVQSLKSHIRKEHVGKTKHYCKPCDKYFAEASGLKIHNRKHGIGAMFPCTKCPKQFPSIGRLNEHKGSHVPASERKDAQCKTCGKKFLNRRSYLDHVKWCGVDRPRFQCHLCPKNYAHKRDLTGHIKDHERKDKGK